jgi:hypothetical protein
MSDDRRWKSNDRWTVTIEREGKSEMSASFTEYDGGDDQEPEAGYPCDVALAAALGQAIKAASPGDEDPWRLAVVVNLLNWLEKFDGSPELAEIADKAKEVFGMLDDGPVAPTEPEQTPPEPEHDTTPPWKR